MEKPAGHPAAPLLTLAACFIALLCLPCVGSASPPPAGSPHFHAPFDDEHYRHDHPLPAGKRAADLNVGAPRTVRMIYFLPNDLPYRAEVVDTIKVVIRRVQTFFGEQMEAHGHGNRTFRFETDSGGQPLVHRLDGQHPFGHYDNTLGSRVVREIGQTFDLNANIYFIVLGADALRQGNGEPAGGVGRRLGRRGGYALVPDAFGWTTVAHELGHDFGLQHDFRDGAYIMSYGGSSGRWGLSACAAEFLAVNPYFNSDSPIQEGEPPFTDAELLSPLGYAPGAESVRVRLRVRDPEGLHQVILFAHTQPGHFSGGHPEVKACRTMAGETEAVVEFDYDGDIPSSVSSSLSNPVVHKMGVVTVDRFGDAGFIDRFGLVELSPPRIAVLENSGRGALQQAAFSPDGTLAVASFGRVELWNAQTRKNIATLPHPDWVSTVSFSPDGTLLASGSEDHTVRLWDVQTRRNVATMEGHTDLVRDVTFSPDGTLLASASRDGTVKLWDVKTRRNVANLEGHTKFVLGVSFAPDGKLLASGSWDGTVKLWNVETRQNIATLRGQRSVGVVAFAPDGKTLFADVGGPIKYWNVKTREHGGTLEGHGGTVGQMTFSPDGTLLASGGLEGTVRLWDVATGTNVAALEGHTHWVEGVAFAPDGDLLFSTAQNGVMIFWDVTEWAGPRPSAVKIISGDGQRGAPGAVLAQPLVVEVRDQYGDPLPNAAVTFSVTAGEGKLSARLTVAHTTTDANGRAALPLTLGPLPGPNTVSVSLGGRQLATFGAEGVGTDVAGLEGDYRTWHLPAGATARLGKGILMGSSDRAVALSADGRFLAVGSAIGAWLYETALSRSLALLKTSSPVHSVVFSPNGALAAGLDNGRVELWESETGQRIGTLSHWDWGGEGRITVVFSPDGTTLASGGTIHFGSSTVKLWDVASRRLTGTWTVSGRFFGSIPVAFSPDGSRLVSGFDDGTVRLWEIGTRTEIATLEGHEYSVSSVSFSPDAALFASAGLNEVILWNVATREQIATLQGRRGGREFVAFSPDGARLLTAGWEAGTVRLWDVGTRQLLETLKGHSGSVLSGSFLPDGITVVSAADDGRVLLRNLDTGNSAGLSGHGSLTSMALSPDGALLASGSWDHTVKLWDVEARQNVATIGAGHISSRVDAVAFSPDGNLLASGGADRTVKLWDKGTRQLVKTLEGHSGRVESLSFSPDGALLASSDEAQSDPSVRLWDVSTGMPAGILQTQSGYSYSVPLSFSPDGTLLASTSLYDASRNNRDNSVRLWKVATRERIATLEGYGPVSFSSHGNLLASGGADRTVKLWDVGTRELVATLEGHSSSVISLSFSRDGAILASGLWEGAVDLWDVGARKRIATLEGHADGVHSVAFSPDGATLFSGSDDGTMLLWDVAEYLAPSMPNPDFNGDGTVGFPDLLLFAAQFGLQKGDAGFNARFDLDGNGEIGFSDLLIFAERFGKRV